MMSAKVSAATGRLNKNVWNRRDISEVTQIKLYWGVVLTTLILWLWNVDNLSRVYKEVKPLSHNLSAEDSWHHMAKTHLQHWSFYSGFSSQHLHHLNAITDLFDRSCCLHERLPPPKETALRWTISEQALLRRSEKALQRNWTY